jgi:hypothetical protein
MISGTRNPAKYAGTRGFSRVWNDLGETRLKPHVPLKCLMLSQALRYQLVEE